MRASKTDDLPRPALDGFAASSLTQATGAWPLRAAEELRSALIFRAIRAAARQVNDARLGPWDRIFANLIGDELRHARLCSFVGARLGATPPRFDLAAVRTRLATLAAPRQRLASLLLVEAAMGETVSTLLFFAGWRETTEPLTRSALASILRDEVRHARLGWCALTIVWEMLDAAERAALAAETARALASMELATAVPAMRRLEAGEPFDDACAALGVLRPEARVDAFYRAIEGTVLPRLDRLGIDGRQAWEIRHRFAVA